MPSASGLFLAAAADPYPHPDLPPESNWPGVMVIIIIVGFFLTAIVLGPIVRAIMYEGHGNLSAEPQDSHPKDLSR